MAFKPDALLIAQKLVTSLLMENMERKNLPYLVIKGKNPAKSRRDKDASTHLSWLEDFYSNGDAIANLDETTVAFDSVDSYSVAYSGSLAEHTMFNGVSVADNFKQSTTVFNISAKISTTSTLSSFSVRQTADLLKEAFSLALPVYLSLPDLTSQSSLGIGIDGLNPRDIYGIITSLNVSRDSNIQDGFNISMTISQPKFSKEVTRSSVIAIPKKTDKEVTEEYARKNPEKIYDNLCGQMMGVRNSDLGFARDRTDLQPPDEFRADLQYHVDNTKDINAGNCDVGKLAGDYEKEYLKFGRG